VKFRGLDWKAPAANVQWPESAVFLLTSTYAKMAPERRLSLGSKYSYGRQYTQAHRVEHIWSF
jgi:hypothetical protein